MQKTTSTPNWREKFFASGIHLTVSLGVALLAAMLVFGLWYPYPYSETSGGRTLFLLVVLVDVVIGPLITLIIFNRNKSRRELWSDLTIVGVLQMAALGYGLWTVFVARPVHLVYEYDRMRVVHAIDLEAHMLAKAPASLQNLPMTGPKPIALRAFADASEQFDATMAAMGGAMLSLRTDLWQSYASRTNDILKSAKPIDELINRFPKQVVLINRAIIDTGRSADQLVYLPMVDRDIVWTVLLDGMSAKPLGFIPIDSF